MTERTFANHLEQFDYEDLFTDLMKSEQRSVAWRAYYGPRADYTYPDPADKVQASWPEVSLSDIPLQQVHHDVRLVDCLRARQSNVLSAMGEPWHLYDLAALLSLAAGERGQTKTINHSDASEAADVSMRTYPSGGALYPVDLYIYVRDVSDLAKGFYMYVAERQALYQIREEITESELAGLFPMTTFQMDANNSFDNTAFIVMLVANLEHSFPKYGRLSHQLALIEAGHIGQNLQLVATSMGKHSLPSCGYFADKIAEMLCVGKNMYKHIVYCMFLG
ncbi:SagB/ThcOx family dehydrogenase [Paenibacillus azoreducens]|uniref:Nitroreductase domain-containing protein n=1 Tax=Paenibacillus azoreducens TaxID=116718 RepID=A0A919Y7X0_9BACL|nr:SagB/ThcOx family dehydrogenase [Paenibacillus azoreducens]GIO46292.1 hypothetical protein J34TS1_10570 [Paenibacillus azoreducens]